MQETDMDMYACDACGYYFDPVFGDDVNGIAANTPFTSLPNDWVCPECGAQKKEFSIIESDDYDDDEDEDDEKEDDDLGMTDDDDDDDFDWDDRND